MKGISATIMLYYCRKNIGGIKMEPMYLSIQQKETGQQIKRLIKEKGFNC